MCSHISAIGQSDQSDGGSKPTASNAEAFVNYNVNVVVRLVLHYLNGVQEAHQKRPLSWDWHFKGQWSLSSLQSGLRGQWREWHIRRRWVLRRGSSKTTKLIVFEVDLEWSHLLIKFEFPQISTGVTTLGLFLLGWFGGKYIFHRFQTYCKIQFSTKSVKFSLPQNLRNSVVHKFCKI